MAIQLEITLRRGYRAAYEIELRLSRPGDLGDVLTLGSLAPDFDPGRLPPIRAGREYGVALGKALLHDEDVRRALSDATAEAGPESLKVRLFVHPDAAALYSVAWETARDPAPPDDPPLLFAGERRIFSRFITSADPRPLYRRQPGPLRVLVAIASPSNLDRYEVNGVALAPIEEALELGRIEQALAGEAVTENLRSSEERVTLDELASRLTRDFDVLYLVCHGTINQKGRPILFLENLEGNVEPVEAPKFVQRVTELRERPRLIVLGSCKSAGAGPGEEYGANGAFVPLGPLLTEAGVPAVVAMQGNVALETINNFVPAFLKYLSQQGSVDRAVSLARSHLVAEHRDWWVPTLLTRLRTGELFRRTGFEGGDERFQQWEELVANIASRKCTPILGPALLERHVGTRYDLAVRLARHFRKFLPRGDRDVLALLAQQLVIVKGPEAIRRQILFLIAEMVAERYQGVMPAALLEPLSAGAPPETLLERLAAVLDFAVEREGPTEPHTVLARLRLPIYITANPDGVLARAIDRQDGVKSVVQIHRWLRGQKVDPDPNLRDYVPSPDRPLVFHFFGSAEDPETIAVAQDHFVDALVAASRPDTTTVPEKVRSALANTMLLFLGFQLDDWSFRSLFRFIMNQAGRDLLRNRIHVAVQVDPEESEFDDPASARDYIARYLDDEKIRIYWGSAGEFVAALGQRQRPPAAGRPAPVPV